MPSNEPADPTSIYRGILTLTDGADEKRKEEDGALDDD